MEKDHNDKNVQAFSKTAIDKQKMYFCKLACLINNGPFAFMVTDINGSIEYVNNSFIKLTGFKTEEFWSVEEQFLIEDCNAEVDVKNEFDEQIPTENVKMDLAYIDEESGDICAEPLVEAFNFKVRNYPWVGHI